MSPWLSNIWRYKVTNKLIGDESCCRNVQKPRNDNSRYICMCKSDQVNDEKWAVLFRISPPGILLLRWSGWLECEMLNSGDSDQSFWNSATVIQVRMKIWWSRETVYPVKCNRVSRLVACWTDQHTESDNDRSGGGRIPISSTSSLSQHKSRTLTEAEFTGTENQ